MGDNQRKKEENRIRCIGCGKVIGLGYIVEGSIELPCKCGVKTRIEAEKKPEGQRKTTNEAYKVLGFELARRLPRM